VCRQKSLIFLRAKGITSKCLVMSCRFQQLSAALRTYELLSLSRVRHARSLHLLRSEINSLTEILDSFTDELDSLTEKSTRSLKTRLVTEKLDSSLKNSTRHWKNRLVHRKIRLVHRKIRLVHRKIRLAHCNTRLVQWKTRLVQWKTRLVHVWLAKRTSNGYNEM